MGLMVSEKKDLNFESQKWPKNTNPESIPFEIYFESKSLICLKIESRTCEPFLLGPKILWRARPTLS